MNCEENAMYDTRNELTANDSYLILKKETVIDLKISYYNNLLDEIQQGKYDGKSIQFDSKITRDSIKFREMLNQLDKAGYYVYQLTRL